MVKINEVIVVEGRYDKAAVLAVADACVIETGGFGIFSDAEKVAMLGRLAETRGVIILTDSDSAGFLIRNHLKGKFTKKQQTGIKHAYIPETPGRERRKRCASKEGLLGVEGMPGGVILDALLRAGVTESRSEGPRITKSELYADGLSGGEGSSTKRKVFLKLAGLPSRLTPNAMLDMINALMEHEEYREILKRANICLQNPRE